MSIHRYPKSLLLFDGLRSITGVALTLGPLVFLDVAWPVTLVLSALSTVFLAFAVRLAMQSLCTIELSGDIILSRGLGVRSLAWLDMTSLKLAHYATPRRQSEGWYQLTIRGDDCVLKVDSTIDGFDDIVETAKRAAEAVRLDLDPATGENLKDFISLSS